MLNASEVLEAVELAMAKAVELARDGYGGRTVVRAGELARAGYEYERGGRVR